MNTIELITLNFKEIRRRSIIVWNGIPRDKYDWKPDPEAMTCIEMVRHVLESQHIYHRIIENRGELKDFTSPWNDQPWLVIEQELKFSAPFEVSFYEMVNSFTQKDLDEIEIIRPAVNQKRKLGDYLLRIAYHEAVHTGQLLDYLRTIKTDRPKVWD